MLGLLSQVVTQTVGKYIPGPSLLKLVDKLVNRLPQDQLDVCTVNCTQSK